MTDERGGAGRRRAGGPRVGGGAGGPRGGDRTGGPRGSDRGRSSRGEQDRAGGPGSPGGRSREQGQWRSGENGQGKQRRSGQARFGEGRSAQGRSAQGRSAQGRPGERRTGTGGGAPRPPRAPEPAIPDEVTGEELDRQVRGELGTLSTENAKQVARHLVMTYTLLDDDPKKALEHAVAAQRRAGRVGLVREAAGLAAYRAGEYELALRELRTARRLTGSQVHLPVMADCERGLGRPERALELASSPEVKQLDRAGQIEMLIVAAGARQDMGQLDAAVVMLQVPELTRGRGPQPAIARLMSAYADALGAAGRQDDAQTWLRRAAVADVDGQTGAAERLGLDVHDGVHGDVVDLLGDDDETADDETADDETADDETADDETADGEDRPKGGS